MSADAATGLTWLPAPDQWDDAVRAAAAGSGDRARLWSALVALANVRLDTLKTNKLDRLAQAHFADTAPEALQTRPERLAVLASATMGHLMPAIRVAALRRRLWVKTFEPGFGQYYQSLLDPASDLARFAPTTVLLALDARHVTRGLDPFGTAADAKAVRDAVLNHLGACWRLCRERLGVPVMQQTILPVFDPLLGGNEHRLPGSRARFVETLNQAIREAADRDGVDILALDDRCRRDGLDAWHQPSLWFKAKQEVSYAAAPLYGDLVARQVAARQGRSSKALVLDLDNTLWGGVIGDDGLNGIILGQGGASGESFLALQAFAKDLARRGIILAVCSKNDEANAKLPFTDHPEMILRLPDIACFVANWDDKASNIKRIARELNIGLDAIVFVDDNPFERNLVRAELPDVAVPEVSEEPALVARGLADAGYFESLGLTQDDLRRTDQYRANAERAELAADTTDLDGYLRGLDMRLVWRRFDEGGRARIVQLINKTNQFNLMTRRLTDQDVTALMEAPDAFGLQLRLLDRFGDNGMISVVTCRHEGEAVAIENWLMSCRVLGRQVETATLGLVAAEAQARGARRLIGTFRPTAKNAMVAEHYRRLGFALHATADDGATTWLLDLEQYRPAAVPMTIIAA